GLNLSDSAVTVVRGIIHHDSGLTRRNRRESERPLDLVVSGDAAPRYRDPIRSIPVLHIKGCDAIRNEGHCVSRLNRIPVVVLDGEHVDLIDRLHTIEVYLHPIWIHSWSGVVPRAAIA